MVNKNRLAKMKQRHKFIEQLRDELKQKIKNVMADESNAKAITQALVVQGMLRMMEKRLLIQGNES
jgi:vacuolar-type H+-ATPase subunit E/Vma4